jgi:acyl-CoA thioester hydrolase
MARIKIGLPEKFDFTTTIPIRITDLNYGGHVGNDTILSIIHEARVQFLRHYGYSELDMAGVSLIMGDAAIEFKGEIFYGGSVRVSVGAAEFTRVGFDLFYKLESVAAPTSQTSQTSPTSSTTIDSGQENWLLVASAKTGMVCFDYSKKKVVATPANLLFKPQV